MLGFREPEGRADEPLSVKCAKRTSARLGRLVPSLTQGPNRHVRASFDPIRPRSGVDRFASPPARVVLHLVVGAAEIVDARGCPRCSDVTRNQN